MIHRHLDRRAVLWFIALALVAAVQPVGAANAALVTRWLDKDYGGVSPATIAAAIEDAREHFASSLEAADDTYVIRIPAGTFDLSLPNTAAARRPRGTIDVSGIDPGPDGRLVISGAGMDRTVLIMDPHVPGIYGRSVYRITFQDLEMTRAKYTVTQGIVVEVAPGKVVLDIQPGFPSPMDIYQPDEEIVGRRGPGRYLRKFINSKTAPQIVTEDNRQLAWRDAVAVPGYPSRWQFNLKHRQVMANYRTGDLVAVKSKHGGQAYWFHTGGEITFQRVIWTDASRGVFRNMDRITILDSKILRSAPINGQIPALSSPGGGPQIGQPRDRVTRGNVVKNLYAEGTGDDAIACFNCAETTFEGNYVTDSFARGILLFRSPGVRLVGNTLVRSPLRHSDGTRQRRRQQERLQPEAVE